MLNKEELLRNTDLQRMAEEGAKIYEEIKIQYEPQESGKFLAIDIETRRAFLGETSSDAVEKAREAIPDKVFYVVKIGHSVAETLASLGIDDL